jgi:ADP-L-glycero-D-manno-heptose 6-epimerase
MILITGGAGFIGSNLAAALCARGDEVVICDRLRSNGKWRNVAKHGFADLVVPETVLDWLRSRSDVEAVVHLGAISSTTETDADLVFDVNVRYSSALWRACAERGVRFIYASSGATYGDGSNGFDDDSSAQALAKLRPLNAYGWSKHYFDRRVLAAVTAAEPRPPQWVGLKFFNVYGPNEYHKSSMQSVVAQKYPLVASGAPVTLFQSHHPDYDDGGQLRDFVHVDDCVRVMTWLLDRPDVSGLYNLGSGQARSFRDLALAIGTAIGRPVDIEYVPTPESIRPNYQYFTQATMARLRNAGYTDPFISLEEGVHRYVQGYLAQSDRYR